MRKTYHILGFLLLIVGFCSINWSSAYAADVQKTGVTKDHLPVFYEDLKAKLTYPMSWNSGKYKNFAEWKKIGRAQVMSALPKEKAVDFAPQILETEDRGSYTAEKIAFNLTAESRVIGLMLVPKGQGPFPAALLLHDHGAKFDIGKEKMIRPWNNEAQETSAANWAAKYFSGRFVGDELAKRGYVVLAVDALGWSDRGIIAYPDQQALASNMMNLGSSLGGLMAYEDMRAADFLVSSAIVNKEKVAAIGFSMGAYRAWQVAALSDKIKAGIAVCWMGTNKGLMVPGNNQLKGQSAFTMLLPGVVNFLDYPDIASLAAPKPMLFYEGDHDKLFPLDAVQEAYRDMKQVWHSQKADKKLTTQIWPGLGHVFVEEEQEAAFSWLDEQFK
jgi:dienelactone hydrolase